MLTKTYSDEVVDGVVMDFDGNGILVGIDVQHASQRVDIRQSSTLAAASQASLSARAGRNGWLSRY